MRALLVLATLAVWGLAIGYWSELPGTIPMHFGLNGVADRFADKTVLSWFWMPALGTVFAVALGFMAPGWLRRMAHANSQMLNMPDRARFRTLSAEARVRVMGATMTPMMWLVIILQLLFGFMVYSSAQVALAHWQTMPMAPIILAVVLIIACSVSLVSASNRAVKDEVAAGAAK
ncbi:MAG: putative membrane protein [Planctomycetota bacterium]|jgi:uncharacterized membrane protein